LPTSRAQKFFSREAIEKKPSAKREKPKPAI